MNGYVLHGIGDIRYEQVRTPALEDIPDGWALIKVKAAGICGSDIPRIYVTGAHRHPLIPGHEFSGKVEDVRNESDRHLVGQRATIFPLIPCMKCAQCQTGHYEMCSDYDYLGSRRDGAFAEYVLAPVRNILPIPDNVTYEQAAMTEPSAVAVHAIRNILEQPGRPGQFADQENCTIVVEGLGTIGLLVIMYLQAFGYKNIIAVGNKNVQKQAVIAMNIPEKNYIESSASVPEAVKDLTGGRGCDVFFECVGNNASVNNALESTAPAGRIMLVGNPASDMNFSRDDYWQILRKQLTVKGTWNSSFSYGRDVDIVPSDWEIVIKSVSEGRTHPEALITHRYDLPDLINGFEIMRDKSEEYIKVMGIF